MAWALKGVRGLAREVFWPDEAAGWSKRVRRWLDEHIKSGGIDVVISTAPPFSAHLAVLSADRRGVPWVADFRDLWTLNHFYALSPLRRAIDGWWEARIFRESDAVTVVTARFAETARRAFPDAAISVVYNGYDPEMFSAPERVTPNQKLTLVYAGSLYGGLRDPAVLFAAIERLISAGRVPADKLHVDFYSTAEAWLTKCVAEHHLESVVTIHGTVRRERVIEAYAAADVLVLIQWDSAGEMTALPAKMLEYLGSGRFTLAIGSRPDGEVDHLLTTTKAGVIVRDVDAAASVIAELYDQFELTGFVRAEGDEAARAQWKQTVMASEMQRAIDAAARRAKEDA